MIIFNPFPFYCLTKNNCLEDTKTHINNYNSDNSNNNNNNNNQRQL